MLAITGQMAGPSSLHFFREPIGQEKVARKSEIVKEKLKEMFV